MEKRKITSSEAIRFGIVSNNWYG